MSVKIRLNNKSLFTQPTLIGARLYEADETSQQPTTAAPAANTQTGTTGQSTAPANGAASTTVSAAQTPDGKQQQNIATTLNGIIINAFRNIGNGINDELKKIQLPQGLQWVAPQKPQTETVKDMVAAVQQFITANLEVAKKSVEAQQKEAAQTQQASTTETPANASAGQTPAAAPQNAQVNQ